MIIETKIVIHDDYCKNTSSEDVAKILSQITDLLFSVDHRTFAEKSDSLYNETKGSD